MTVKSEADVRSEIRIHKARNLLRNHLMLNDFFVFSIASYRSGHVFFCPDLLLTEFGLRANSASGDTIPPDIIILKASSIGRLVSTILSEGTSSKKPVVGFGLVGIKTLQNSFPSGVLILPVR